MRATAVDLQQRLPNLLIAGVKKAGTTSLAHYLGQHPDVCAGDVKTVNYFKGVTPGTPAMSLGDYAEHWAHAAGEPYRLESPTTYFYWGRAMAEAVDRTLFDPRVVVSLRDPVTRLWSDFLMKRREDPARFQTVTFEEFVRRGELAHRDGDLRAHRGFASVARGMYAEVAETWFDVFGDRFRVVFFEQWSRDPARHVRDLCGWLELDAAPVDHIQFPVRNARHDFRSRRVARAARVTFRRARSRFPRVGQLKPALVAAHWRVNGCGGDEVMSPAMEAHLRALYHGSNRALATMLRARGYRTLPGWLREAP